MTNYVPCARNIAIDTNLLRAWIEKNAMHLAPSQTIVINESGYAKPYQEVPDILKHLQNGMRVSLAQEILGRTFPGDLL
jgi:hypothetical protein